MLLVTAMLWHTARKQHLLPGFHGMTRQKKGLKAPVAGKGWRKCGGWLGNDHCSGFFGLASALGRSHKNQRKRIQRNVSNKQSPGLARKNSHQAENNFLKNSLIWRIYNQFLISKTVFIENSFRKHKNSRFRAFERWKRGRKHKLCWFCAFEIFIFDRLITAKGLETRTFDF